MPAPTLSPSSSGPAGSILLVEEYEALAAAVGSALGKFAPASELVRVRSLLEADEVLEKVRPALILVDFDPPLPGVVEFLAHCKEKVPGAHLLILTGEPPPEIVQARSSPGLHFIAKPFELEAFGLSVQSFLGKPGGPRPQNPPGGSIRDLALSDLIALHCLGVLTGILQVETAARRTGEVHFVRGQLRHAKTRRLEGDDAVQEMMSWGSPRYRSSEERSDAPRTVIKGWAEVLEEALSASAPAPESATLPDPAEPLAGPPRDGKKIVVIDDTEMLRVFVEEMLLSADPTLRITSAEDGARGVAEVAGVVPDLVLLDFSLPDFNGDEVARHLLEDARTARIPVIMMSGHVPEMKASEARFENIVATLPKPFLSPALVELVQETLRNPPAFRSRQLVSVVEPSQPTAVTSVTPLVVSIPEQFEPPSEQPIEAVISPIMVLSTETSRPPELPSQLIQFPSPALFGTETPARIAAARDSGVIVGLPLEVVSMQFSSALQMAAIRARPSSLAVALHVDPRALGGALPEAGFELDRVDLDARGQIQTMRLTPTVRRPGAIEAQTAMPVGAVAVLSSYHGRALELTPAARAPMKMQLLASFELAGVELNPDFTVSHLILKARGGKMRVSLQPEAANTGATFQTAQVLLDRSARIAEILLDAVA